MEPVRLYFATGSLQCRRARHWLITNDIPFVDVNIDTRCLRDEEIRHLLFLSENGTSDILASRSEIYKTVQSGLDDLKLTELIQLLGKKPHLLRIPIVAGQDRMVVGFDENEYTIFKPRRRIDMPMQMTPVRAHA